MLLHVFTGNEAAIGFYTREGYTLRRIQQDCYGQGLDAFIYSKALGN